MQVIVDNFSQACDAFRLKISLKKTKVMFTPPPVLSKDGSLDAEVYACIQKASVVFGRLERRVWNDRRLTINTKVDVYMACVVTVLLYATETWTTH